MYKIYLHRIPLISNGLKRKSSFDRVKPRLECVSSVQYATSVWKWSTHDSRFLIGFAHLPTDGKRDVESSNVKVLQSFRLLFFCVYKRKWSKGTYPGYSDTLGMSRTPSFNSSQRRMLMKFGFVSNATKQTNFLTKLKLKIFNDGWIIVDSCTWNILCIEKNPLLGEWGWLIGNYLGLELPVWLIKSKRHPIFGLAKF